MSTDNAPYVAIAQEFEAAWNAHDAQKLGEKFAEDGYFIDFMGHLVHGKQGFVSVHQTIFTTVMAESEMKVSEVLVQPVTDDVKIVRLVWHLRGERAPGATTASPPREGRLTLVVAQRKDRVEIVSVQNTEMQHAASAAPRGA